MSVQEGRGEKSFNCMVHEGDVLTISKSLPRAQHNGLVIEVMDFDEFAGVVISWEDAPKIAAHIMDLVVRRNIQIREGE